MKLLVISDTHGRIEPISAVIDRMDDIDMLIHLGDFEQDADILAERHGLDLLCVPGNMDGCMNTEQGERILTTEYGDILLTHGHLRDVRWSSDRLVYAAQEKGCRAVFFGHTHRSQYEETDEGIILLNPGSTSLPRDGNPPSYAIVRTSEERLECGIRFISDPCGSDPDDGEEGGKKKIPHGRLRGMLNYSDRF